MKWLKKYWWYNVISFSSSFIGGIICITITNKNIGSFADWVSGIGSLLAIAFAYWQIHIQTKEYEEDKKEKINREILANRPFFSCKRRINLKSEKDHLWVTGDDINSGSAEKILKIDEEGYGDFISAIAAYEFKNVSQAVATNVVLKIEYKDVASNETLKEDCSTIRTSVIGKERAIMLPHSIVDESKDNDRIDDESLPYSYCPKIISLYFTTIDDRAYCQRWVEKTDKINEWLLYIEQVDIKEVSKKEIPNGIVCRRIPVILYTNKDT